MDDETKKELEREVEDMKRKLERLNSTVYGDEYASPPKDGLVRRVGKVENEQKSIESLVPWLEVFTMAVKYLGLPAVGGALYALFQYFGGGAP